MIKMDEEIPSKVEEEIIFDSEEFLITNDRFNRAKRWNETFLRYSNYDSYQIIIKKFKNRK